MTLPKIARLTAQSLRRNLGDLALSSVGIVVGIGALLLFTSLGAGVKSVVLQDVFVVRQLEVVPKRVSVGAMGRLLGSEDSAEPITDETVEEIRGLDGVEAAYPKMKLTFPSSVRGGERLIGRDVVAELVGDGIPPRLVENENLGGSVAFRDWEGGVPCGADTSCPGGFSCRDSVCTPDSCSAGETEACPGPARCDEEAGRCRMPIPVIASNQVLELYNGSLQTAFDGAAGSTSRLPELSAEDLVGVQVTALFGRGYLGPSAEGEPLRRELRLVGFSDRAIRLGATMPIGYVERLNRRFRGDAYEPTYHSIVIETASNDDVARIARKIRRDFDSLELGDRYETSRRTSLLIVVLTVVFDLIAFLILAIAAINIAHTFLMILVQRRREIGLMRALGAARGDIRILVLAESTVVGLAGGACGILVGLGGTALIDYLFATQVGDFPFKPESLFSIEPWMIGASLGVALLFCWIGALLPAFRASDVDPADALSGR